MLKLYRALTILAAPFIFLYLYYRKSKGKEDPHRFMERLGKASFPRPKGMLIWVHAASVGESISMLPMINAIVEDNPTAHLLLTTGTVSSAQLIESRLPDRAFHQYVPIDIHPFIRRFLKHWKPDLAIWVESEFWPNLITETRKQCAMLLVNGRVSNESLQKWRALSSLGKHMLSSFVLSLPQSEEDGKRLRELGAKNVKYIGNLKFDSPSLPADPKEMNEILNMIDQRHVWLAASTHPGEEELIADVHNALKEEYEDLLTIIVPRHAKRGRDIVNMLESKVNIAQRSKKEPITADTDIYLADTMGELGLFYRLSSIVFIGGSLVNHGGQNPLEAGRLHCAVILGPFMDNFAEITRELEETGACERIHTKKELQLAVDELFRNQEKQDKLAEAILEVVNNKGGMLNIAMRELNPYLEAANAKNNNGEPERAAA